MLINVTDMNISEFLRTWMTQHVTDMNGRNFYGHELYKMLLTCMLLTFMCMKVTTCYWHECYYLLRTWKKQNVTDLNVIIFYGY